MHHDPPLFAHLFFPSVLFDAEKKIKIKGQIVIHSTEDILVVLPFIMIKFFNGVNYIFLIPATNSKYFIANCYQLMPKSKYIQ